MRDFRYALRSLRQAPALVAVAVLSLALAIGANITVFSVVREMILDDLSARRPEELSRVDGARVSYTVYRELRATGPFADLAYYRGLGDRIWQTRGHGEIVWILTTSANFFDVLGIPASRGRLYAGADEGREYAVVSYGFWQRRLAADPEAPGRTIELNGRLYTILGVLPANYRSVYGHGVSPEVYLSDPGNTNPNDRIPGLFGRLREGFSRDETRRSFVAAMDRLAGFEPSHAEIVMQPMSGLAANAAKGGDDRRFFVFFAMLYGVAGALLLIGCSNVAALLVARGFDRRREMAIRLALGANRWQFVRPRLAEGTVLVLGGTVCGFVLDAMLRRRLSYLRWPSAYGIPFEFHFASDRGLWLYGGLCALAALLLSSLLPVWRGARADLTSAMKTGEPPLLLRFDLRHLFVTVQVVLSIVLLVPGGLFVRSLLHLVQTGPGFDVTHTLIVAVHTLRPRTWDFRMEVIRRVETVPGVAAVTSTSILPLMGELPDALVRREGAALPDARRSYFIGAGENYCNTMGIAILRGRDFDVTDHARQPLPVIINRTLAHAMFADADPVGQYLLVGPDAAERAQILGVAADTRMRTLGEGNAPAFFRPDQDAQLLVRVAGNATQWIEPLRTAVGPIDPSAAVEIRPLAEAAAGALFPLRVASGFVGSFSLLGAVLAMVGLYGSVSYAVGRRTREFGIRAALGASRGNIVRTAARDGVVVLVCGGVAGVPLALVAIRPLADLIPAGVDPWAVAPMMAVVLLLVAAGLLASWIPARRAAQTLPAIALRQD